MPLPSPRVLAVALVLALSGVLVLREETAPATFDLSPWRFAEDAAATEPPPNWTVDGEVLRGTDQEGPPLLSQWDQEDFELTLEWRALTEGARGEVLVKSDRGRLGRGLSLDRGREGIWPGVVGTRAAPTAHRPVGEWNRWRFTLRGDSASLSCNENFAWGVRGLDVRRGYLGLVVHEGAFEFRNVEVAETEYEPLSDPSAWVGLGEHWKLEGQHLSYDGADGDLLTAAEFQHYVLRFEWRIPKGSNSGVYLRGVYPWQVEIWDDPRGSGLYLGDGPDDVVLPRRPADVPVGLWNFVEVALVQGRATVWTNGELVVPDLDLAARDASFPDHGPIGLQDHRTPVEFRHLRVRTVRDDPPAIQRFERSRRKAAPEPPPLDPAAGPLAPEDSAARLELPAGFAARLVAAEPDLVNPVCLAAADASTLYVSESTTYRQDEPPAGSLAADGRVNAIRLLRLTPDGTLAEARTARGGFPSPVMGLACGGDTLYATCNEELLRLPVQADGGLGPPTTLVRVRTPRWNPFGMFRVVLGPDGRLWFSVGGSPTEERLVLEDADGVPLAVPGGGGGVFRCETDGRGLELLVRGVRVAFGFEVDDHGELWIAESGQDGPDRLIHAVLGADYGFESEHLTPEDPLVPPFVRLAGSFTSVLRYDGAGLPWDLHESLLVTNWGSHGQGPPNRRVERWRLVDGEPEPGRPLVTSSDPRFRPTQVAVAGDEGLWLLDWYGADDENDDTGRLLHLAYEGVGRGAAPAPPPTREELDALASGELAALLADPRRGVRRAARGALLGRGERAAAALGAYLGGRPGELGAREALWCLAALRSRAAAPELAVGIAHPDPGVRALALRLLREAAGLPLSGGVLRAEGPAGAEHEALLPPDVLVRFARPLLRDPDPGVALEAALALPPGELRGHALVRLLAEGPADARLVHRAAAELGRTGAPESLALLRRSSAPAAALDVALATALLEGTELAGAANEIVLERLADPRETSLSSLIRLATLDPAAGTRDALRAALRRPEVGVFELAEGVSTLLDLGLAVQDLSQEVVQLLRRLETEPFAGTTAQRIRVLHLLERIAPPKLPVSFLIDSLDDTRDRVVAVESHRTVRELGVHDPRLLAFLAEHASLGQGALVRLASITTLAAVSPTLDTGTWLGFATERSELIAFAALRAIRLRPGQEELRCALLDVARNPGRRSEAYRIELRSALARLGTAREELDALGLPADPTDRAALTAKVLAELPKASTALGELSFWTSPARCTTCHSLDGTGGRRGPALDGIGAEARPPAILESILDPSATIKAGYESWSVETVLGETLTGLVTERDGYLFVDEGQGEPVVVPLEEVAERHRQGLSIMPEGLEVELTARELADLVAFLATREGR